MSNGTYLISYLSIHRDFHRNNLTIQPRMQHRPEIAKLALTTQQTREMHHLVLWRLILAVPGLLVCVHCSWCSRIDIPDRVEGDRSR